jgi:hypothetical protein
MFHGKQLASLAQSKSVATPAQSLFILSNRASMFSMMALNYLEWHLFSQL